MNNTLGLFFIWSLALIIAPKALALPEYPRDCNDLLITSFSDPNFPVSRIGERQLEIFHDDPAVGSITKVELLHSDRPEDLEGSGATITEASRTALGGGSNRSAVILPWSQPGDSHLTAKPTDTYAAGTTVYYRWRITTQAAGQITIETGDRHEFTMPRRIIFAILGDSFGSGEGAPSKVGQPWQFHNEGVKAHRSPISGQELAIKAHMETRPNLAYDYVNLSSSGAISTDIFGPLSQAQRTSMDAANDDDPLTDPAKPQGVTFVQATRLSEWLTTRDYDAIDAVILSCGGNDLGFATILTNYLGLNMGVIGDAALAALPDPLCITLGVAAFGIAGGPFTLPLSAIPALAAYTACIIPVIIDRVLQAIREDATFKDPYQGGGISNFKEENFAFFTNLLTTNYRLLGDRISNGLLNNGKRVKVSNVLVTEYPFPLKDCRTFWETPPLVSLIADKKFFSFQLADIPGLSFVREPTSFSIDLTSFRPVTVGFSATETVEASTELAPPSSAPRPSVGGLNHFLADTIGSIDSANSNTDWCFVQTADFLPPRTGVCYSGTHFNTLTTANDQAGPNILNNAYHPNQRGHEFTYQPAILDSLQRKLDLAALESLASEEGLRPANTPAPDLTFVPGSVSFLYDEENRILNFSATVINQGNVSSPEGTLLSLILRSRNPASFEPESLPSLDIDDTYTFSRELELPATTLLDKMPYDCPSAPFAGFEDFADTDDVLLYFLSTEQASFSLDIDAAETIGNEINTRNNVASETLSLRADASTLNLNPQDVLNDLTAVVGVAVTEVDFALLATSSKAREYFGYYSRELDQLTLSPSQSIIAQQIANLDRCAAVSLGLEPPLPPDPQPREGLRPICLFQPEEENCPPTALGRTAEDDIRSYEEILANAPRDGRSIVITAVINEQIAGLLENPLLEFDYELPQVGGGIQFPPESEPLDTRDPSFGFDGVSGAAGYALTLGTQPGSSDLLAPTLIEPKDGVFQARDLPQDGRTVYATFTTLTNEGTQSSEEYQFQTIARNATLTSPGASSFLSANGTLTWSTPDASVAGPVQGYSVAIGSYPGTGDIVPGAEALGGLGDSQGRGAKNNLDALNFVELSNEENQYTPSNLPTDGRTLYVTLGTRRDNEWQYEIFKREALEANSPSLRLPRADRPLNSRETFQLSPGQVDAEAYRIRLGTTQGGDDLFDSGLLDPLEAEQPFSVVLADLEIQTDSQERPFPIWASVESLGGRTPSQQHYGLIPSLHASIYSPDPAAYQSPNEDLQIEWSAGYQAEGYRLRAYARSAGESPFYDQAFGPGDLEAAISIEGREDSAVVIVLDTLRAPDSEFLSDGSYTTAFLINQPSLTYYAGDEIDDVWQLRNFGPSNPEGLATADPDGDGCDNLCEFLARTNPNDPSDFFRSLVNYDAAGNPLSFTIDKPVFSTRYQLTDSEDLEIWFNLGSPVSPAAGAESLTLPLPAFPVPDQPKRFFQLQPLP